MFYTLVNSLRKCKTLWVGKPTTMITDTIVASSLRKSVIGSVLLTVVVALVINAVKVSQNVACHKMCFSFSSYAVTIEHGT